MDTIVHKEQSQLSNSLSLETILLRKDDLINQYISTSLLVVELNPKQTINKNGQELTLYKLTGFANDLLVQVALWNQQID